MASEKKGKFRLSFSATILLGFVLGISCGLFFGEYVAPLKIIGLIFVRLLQMTILPFIVISLIAGIGRLTYSDAKSFAVKAGLVLLLLWGIGFAVILALPLMFPVQETASFFSSSMIEAKKEVDILDLYIPSNPFSSMANAIIPAIVLFCIAIGIALIGIEEKAHLIQSLTVLSTALTKVAHAVVKVTPIGVFALSASAAGTMTVEEFGRLQAYFVTYCVAALFLTFWVLPILVTVCTPFRYKDVVAISKDALITGFTTLNLMIILPILSKNCKDLFEQYRVKTKNSDFYIDILLPVSFNFPNLGKLLILLFVLFAAWFAGSPLSLTEYPVFVVSGLFTFFAHTTVAIPFLLDSFQIPADLFQLFLATGILISPFATLLAAMSLLAFTVISTSAISGSFSVNWKKVAHYSLVTAVLALGIFGGTRAFLSLAATDAYSKHKIVAGMQLLQNPVPAVVHKAVPPVPAALDLGKPRLARIRERGVLRVGYRPDFLPFSYFNENGDLVGFDIDMAHRLARELGVTLEFIPAQLELMPRLLNNGHVDIIMSAVAVTPQRLEKVSFSASYLDATLAVIVKDHRRKEFSTIEAIRKMKGVAIGVPYGASYFISKVKDALPFARVVEVKSVRDYFENLKDDVDALLFAAEAGSAWTLLYPDFQVVVPKPVVISQPVAYPIAAGDQEMVNFMNRWIELKKKDNTIERLFDYWVLGKGARKKEPRWSIIRNVLHWVE